MPCSDDRPFYFREDKEEELRKLRKRNNELMRAICEIDNKVIQVHVGSIRSLSDDTRKLITKHRRDDAKRGK